MPQDSSDQWIVQVTEEQLYGAAQSVNVKIARIRRSNLRGEELVLQLADFTVGAALSVDALFGQATSFNFSAQVHQQSRHKWANTLVDKIANH